MRIRTIKPEFFKHDGIAALPPLTRILFIGLWSLADRDGRLEDRPARIRVEVLPYDDIDPDKELDALHQAGLIVRYQADGLQLIEIPSFARHQRITGKEAEAVSRFPKYDGETMGKQRGNTRETTETTGNGRETEGKRKGLPEVSRSARGGFSGEHKAFIEGWTSNFREHFGFDYVFDGGRDGRAVKEVLGFNILRIDLLEIAKRAWKRSGQAPKAFACEQAATIHGFKTNLSRIQVELLHATTPTLKAGTKSAEDRLCDDLDRMIK